MGYLVRMQDFRERDFQVPPRERLEIEALVHSEAK